MIISAAFHVQLSYHLLFIHFIYTYEIGKLVLIESDLLRNIITLHLHLREDLIKR